MRNSQSPSADTTAPHDADSGTDHPGGPGSALGGFSAPVREWFTGVFAAPTPVQEAAWATIRSHQSCLVVAPTGSGKTLAAFLQGIDDLLTRPRTPGSKQVRVVYVSPLKALAVDVERNLRAPLRGVALAAERLGLPAPQIQVAVRSGDTPPAERRRILAHPPDILITTPESLFLMMSSSALDVLAGVETVILDEVHALAGTKRGAHLMVSVERLAALHPERHLQRIALSATVRPPERVAAFVGGLEPVTVVAPPATKRWDLSIQVPVPDITHLPAPPGAALDEDESADRSIWPFVEARLLDLVLAHRTSICFVNSRRVAERVTAHLNELYQERLSQADSWPDPDSAQPSEQDDADSWPDPNDPGDHNHTSPDLAHAGTRQQVVERISSKEVLAPAGVGDGEVADPPPVLARAHHGSVSKERRAVIESDLKAGRLRCVVATSSLELGIDMGAVDLVLQVQSPPSVASGLQRIGRAGHQVGGVSTGVVLPTHRGDLLQAAVVVDRMQHGRIEEVTRLRNPLDVLAQQILSMCLRDGWTADSCFDLVRRTDPYRDLPRAVFDEVLDMLAGRYPDEEFSELRPRLVWDRATGSLTARPGGRRLVTTSGGTIPDRGLYGVFLPAAEEGSRTPGRRVGELDEEMVYESRLGDIFTLGSTSWRIREITPDRVIVDPAPGLASRLPFWHGDQASRPIELGRALGEMSDQLVAATPTAARALLTQRGLDPFAVDNLISYLDEQRAATGVVPGADTILVERFHDELGDWRVCVHAPLGTAVLQPWALAVQQRLRAAHGAEVRASVTNDGIILRVPDSGQPPPGVSDILLDADDVRDAVTDEVMSSPLFAARFRECATRALLLPRRDPGRRAPLWQQRQRAAQLMAVALRHPSFPITLETLRECLEDVFDLPSLERLLGDLAARRVRVAEVETEQPSPFARSLLFGYVGEFIYDQDQPLAERRAAAVSVDPELLAELLGTDASEALFDADAAASVEADLQRLAEPARATTAEALWDVVRTLGPLTGGEIAARGAGAASEWLDELVAAHRVFPVTIASTTMFVVADDIPLVRDALGVPAPPGAPVLEDLNPDQALARLVERWVRTHTAVTAADLAGRWAVPEREIRALLHAGIARGTLVELSLGAASKPGAVIHAEVLARVRRRTIAALRAGVEPVPPERLFGFLATWQELDRPASGPQGLLQTVDQLAGWAVPATSLETLVLPVRVADWSPMLLDQALAAGEITWTGHEPIGGTDGWIQLWPADAVIPRRDRTTPEGLAGDVLGLLGEGGAWRSQDLAARLDVPTAHLDEAIWQLVWAGWVTSDTFAPLRRLAAHGALRTPSRPRPTRRMALRSVRPRLTPAGLPGRWSLITGLTDPTQATLLACQFALGRHGVLTRPTASVEASLGTWTDTYRTLAAMEDTGVVRRGYFVDGLGAAQFAVPGAVDRLRSGAGPSGAPSVLAACDPANPCGAALAWPSTAGPRPSRRAGAVVVLDDAGPIAWLERGLHTLVTFGREHDDLVAGLRALAQVVAEGRLPDVHLDQVDATPALESGRTGEALLAAGFVMTPRGYRARSGRSAAVQRV